MIPVTHMHTVWQRQTQMDIIPEVFRFIFEIAQQVESFSALWNLLIIYLISAELLTSVYLLFSSQTKRSIFGHLVNMYATPKSLCSEHNSQ